MKKETPNAQKEFSVAAPPSILQTALEQIEVFAKQGAGCLEVQEDGKLIATSISGLDKIKGIVRSFVSPIFSEKIRVCQHKKINQIKEELLNARDIIQSHSLLIEKLKEGDSYEQKWAHWALESIKSYNAVVSAHQIHNDQAFNFDRQQVLLDEEIKGKEITLPHVVSIKFDSNPNSFTIQQTLKELSQILGETKTFCTLASKPKKMDQVMFDAFRMKGIRRIQQHWPGEQSLVEIMPLIQRTPISYVEGSTDTVSMKQVLEILPGSIMILTGNFKKQTSTSKFMGIPILEDFHLSFQFTQTGFPYPSQHLSWALSNAVVNAQPLRYEQVPVFIEIDQKKKKLAQSLLYNHDHMQRVKLISEKSRKHADKNIFDWIDWHKKLQIAILKASEVFFEEAILEAFYAFVLTTDGPFDTLSLVQEKICELFFEQPTKKLQEDWLSGSSFLREGSPQDKFKKATEILKHEHNKELRSLEQEKNPVHAFMYLMGNTLGPAVQSIILQYMSEKMSFVPPMLSDFERKVQTSAFQQLLTFLETIEKNVFAESVEEINSLLLDRFKKDIAIFTTNELDALGLAYDLTQELEAYFNSRFYAKGKFV